MDKQINKQIDLVSFGSDGFNLLFKNSQKVEVRTIKDMNQTFRGRTFEDCEGTDFWDITEEERKVLMKNSVLDQIGHL